MANDDDTVALKPSDNDGEEIAYDKRPTKPTQPFAKQHVSLELDLEDPEAVASFLEAVALSIRAKRRIKLVVE